MNATRQPWRTESSIGTMLYRRLTHHLPVVVLVSVLATGEVADARNRQSTSLLAPNVKCGATSDGGGEVIFEGPDPCETACTITYHIQIKNLVSDPTKACLSIPQCGECDIELPSLDKGEIQLTSAQWSDVLAGNFHFDLYTDAFTLAGGKSELVGTPTKGPPTGIPAVSTWGVVVMALLLLAAGTIVLRRRHHRQPNPA